MKQALLALKDIIALHQQTLTYMVLGIVIFQLSILYSKDWIEYQHYYNTKIAYTDWPSFLNKISVFKEPIYLFSAKLFGQLIGYQAFVFLSTVILLVFKLHFLNKITKCLYVSTFFYICFYLFLFEGTAIRIGYAVAFVIAGLYFLKQQKWLYAFMLIMIASQVHLTALVFLIAFPIYYFRWVKVSIYISFILSPLVVIFDISVVSLIQSFVIAINPKYSFYFNQEILKSQNSTGLFFYFIIFFTMLLSVTFYYLRNMLRHDKFLETIFLITLCAIISMCVFHNSVALSARIGELLLMPIVILLSRLYMEFDSKNMNFHLTALVVLSLSFLSARVMYLYPTLVFG